MKKGLELADVVITTGGTSMGEGDLVKVNSSSIAFSLDTSRSPASDLQSPLLFPEHQPRLEHVFNATIHFGRVAMAPGKPTTFATVPWPPTSTPARASSAGRRRER